MTLAELHNRIKVTGPVGVKSPKDMDKFISDLMRAVLEGRNA